MFCFRSSTGTDYNLAVKNFPTKSTIVLNAFFKFSGKTPGNGNHSQFFWSPPNPVQLFQKNSKLGYFLVKGGT